jgi:hypothetical protein
VVVAFSKIKAVSRVVKQLPVEMLDHYGGGKTDIFQTKVFKRCNFSSGI